MKSIKIYRVISIVILFGMAAGVLSACGDRPEDIVIGTVVSTSENTSGRFGLLLFVEQGRGKGSIRAYSTGAEGEGYRPCDYIKINCWADTDTDEDRECVARELLKKFIGTPDECQATLLERGILQK